MIGTVHSDPNQDAVVRHRALLRETEQAADVNVLDLQRWLSTNSVFSLSVF